MIRQVRPTPAGPGMGLGGMHRESDKGAGVRFSSWLESNTLISLRAEDMTANLSVLLTTGA